MLTLPLLALLAASVVVPAPEGCGAFDPGMPSCSYLAASNGGIGGYSQSPLAWKVTIERPGEPSPLVIASSGGVESYACGTIMPGDTVTVTAGPGSFVAAGNPGFCV